MGEVTIAHDQLPLVVRDPVSLLRSASDVRLDAPYQILAFKRSSGRVDRGRTPSERIGNILSAAQGHVAQLVKHQQITLSQGQCANCGRAGGRDCLSAAPGILTPLAYVRAPLRPVWLTRDGRCGWLSAEEKRAFSDVSRGRRLSMCVRNNGLFIDQPDFVVGSGTAARRKFTYSIRGGSGRLCHGHGSSHCLDGLGCANCFRRNRRGDGQARSPQWCRLPR